MQITSFEQLREIYKNDARYAFLRFRALTPGESIYGFALSTDDDAYGASGIANTEERHAEFLAEYPIDDTFFARWVLIPVARWAPEEWPALEGDANILVPDDPPPDASQFTDQLAFMEAMETFSQRWQSQTGKTFRQFRAKTLRAMVEALRHLDREGLFWTGRERDRITIFVSISDSEDSSLLEMRSATLANPRRAARRLTHVLPFPFPWIVWFAYLWRRLRKGPMIASSL